MVPINWKLNLFFLNPIQARSIIAAKHRAMDLEEKEQN